MLKLTQDFDRFAFLPRQTAWQKRIRAELRFVQTLGQPYEPLLAAALQILQTGLQRDGVISNQTAEAAEQQLLPAAPEAKRYRYLCAGHAHIDMNWMWGYDETINTVIDTCRTMLQIMKEYPDFCFSQSQASVYQILELYAPEMLEEVRARVREGRWEITASAWVETDKNMACGESLSRHILYAKTYLQNLFGLDPDSLEVDFDPDTFGHSMNVPEISARGGVKYYYHCRGRIGERIINRWRSPAGSELLLYTEPFWYNGEIDTAMGDYAVKLAEITGSKTLLKVYGVGDHGGGPTRRDLDRLIEMDSWPVYPRFTFSTFRDYFHTLEERRESFPVLEGEINFLCDGCYTTQSRIKAGNRNSERALQDAELFDALSVVRAEGVPHQEIFAEAWKRVLFNQFHDIIPGSGVTETREYASARYQEALGAAQARRKQAFSRLADRMDTAGLVPQQDVAFSRGEGGGPGFGGGYGGCGHSAGLTRVYHLFNPCPWDRTEVTEFVVWDYEGDEDRLSVRLPEGDWVPTQILEKDGYWGHRFVRLLAKVSAPASGWATVLIGQKPVEPGCCFVNDMRTQHAETFVLENDLVKAVFDPKTASLTSFYHKQTGRELLPAGKQARFELATEAVNKEVTGWGGGMSAWFTGRQKAVEPLTAAEMRPLPGGEVRSRLEISLPFRSSKLRVEVSLDRDSTMLRYQVGCDWREFGSDENGVPCLQFTLPTVCAGEKFLYDVPFGFVEREGREMDLPADRFVAARDDGGGLLLTAKTKYGYRTGNGRMAVTLIRGAYNPDPTPEIGHHDMEFGIDVLPREASRSLCDRIVRDYEHPVYTMTGAVHSGSLPASMSGPKLLEGAVCLSSVKISEDGKAVVVKLYEAEGKNQTFCLDCGFRPAAAVEADQLERPAGKALAVEGSCIRGEAKPFQLLLLRLER